MSEGLSTDLGHSCPRPTAFHNIQYQLLLGFSQECVSRVQALVRALPLVHPQLRLLHDGAQLVQVRLDLLVVLNILACDQQLDLGGKNALVCLDTELDLCDGPFCCSVYLFESLQDFLSLAEMTEEQMKRSGHQWRVVVHSEVQQDTQEGSAAVIIQVQWCVLLTTCTHRTYQLSSAWKN